MRTIVVLFLVPFLAAGCQRPAPPAPPPGPKSPAGWDVRYDAAQALARRGSPQVKDPAVWESLLEMLDEGQQLRNFTQTRGGREVCDDTAARLVVIGALKAVTELHQKRPDLDLTGLKDPIAKLTQSANVPLRTEARQAQLALSQ
jgi:hypothetical protein